ncbi:MAG: MtnX-like HAD-IB family phosphatase [Dehalogenimonas sp.]|uniref:MtnX-like HAD-IB family phosphatase n=1 Tax=Candidatus Dehalogenimonas loeffleri TaxID=3127115 RepID=A0ABZ2J4U5_9CHLR|nr:MtnX-like HAD-IB family phosphatase [Dehalogenimonas sp.]
MTNKTLLQCDFDGTITEGDISFLILERYAEGDWRAVLRDYQQGIISVGDFNNRAFAFVKQNRETLENLVREEGRIRPGLTELVDFCAKQDITMTVVSNGLDFYIKTLLGNNGFSHIKIIAAKTVFTPRGMDARYYNHHGEEVLSQFKESYTRQFIEQGYKVYYAGNGPSDVPASRLAAHAFATESLLDFYRRENLPHTSFEDLRDIVTGLKSLA